MNHQSSHRAYLKERALTNQSHSWPYSNVLSGSCIDLRGEGRDGGESALGAVRHPAVTMTNLAASHGPLPTVYFCLVGGGSVPSLFLPSQCGCMAKF